MQISVEQLKLVFKYFTLQDYSAFIPTTPESVDLVAKVEMELYGEVRTDFNKTDQLQLDSFDLEALITAVVRRGQFVDTAAQLRIKQLETENEELTATLEMYEKDLTAAIRHDKESDIA